MDLIICTNICLWCANLPCATWQLVCKWIYWNYNDQLFSKKKTDFSDDLRYRNIKNLWNFMLFFFKRLQKHRRISIWRYFLFFFYLLPRYFRPGEPILTTLFIWKPMLTVCSHFNLVHFFHEKTVEVVFFCSELFLIHIPIAVSLKYVTAESTFNEWFIVFTMFAW